MRLAPSSYRVSLATSQAEVEAAQRLRYQVFVQEMGSTGALVDHERGLEIDGFDAAADHLLLWDGADVVGAYRLLDQAGAEAAGGYYSAAEFDLRPLLTSGRSLLELGRSCLAPAHRGGTAMMHLWNGLARHVERRGTDILFGVASFPGTDLGALAGPISLLHHAHLAPPAWRVRSLMTEQPAHVPADQIDRVRAMRETPSLIKAYLRMGGRIGQGVYVDHAFNTTDVCMVMDTQALSPRHRALYARSSG